MLFNRKNNMKTKKSDYQVLKDIILKNDNQTSKMSCNYEGTE